MKLNRLNINYYSFGYLGGFVDKSKDKFTVNGLIKFANKHKLGGVEFPIDYLLKNFNDLSQLLINNNMDIFISIENFSVEKIKSIVPYLKKNNIHKARIKMSNHFGGNRYKIKTFKEEYISFQKKLISLKSFLIDNHFQLLIENHQDLNSYDILYIIDLVSSKCIGVNWDIGNSLATGETPTQFYNNVKDHIFNIHIKDYKALLKKRSLELYRCPIGDGNIGLNKILNLLKDDNYQYSMSIELGAYRKRVSHIFNENYWNEYSYFNNKHKSEYFNYLNSTVKKSSVIIGDELVTKKLELLQIEKSIHNLKYI
jgi:sugar phosphate isomerase/epimerase